LISAVVSLHFEICRCRRSTLVENRAEKGLRSHFRWFAAQGAAAPPAQQKPVPQPRLGWREHRHSARLQHNDNVIVRYDQSLTWVLAPRATLVVALATLVLTVVLC
jgi:hypothetical protein